MLCAACAGLLILHTKKVCIRCKSIIYTNLYVLCDKCADQDQVCNICLKKINKNIKNNTVGCRCGS